MRVVGLMQLIIGEQVTQVDQKYKHDKARQAPPTQIYHLTV